MDAEELLRGGQPFVADTSAWWRAAALPDNLGSLIQQAVLDDRFWITPIVRMEILYSARTSSEFLGLESELDALRILRNDRAVADAAMSALGELAQRGDGYHRVPPTDAVIAAAAAEHGGLAVLHRDAHFDRLAEVLAFESVELAGL
ncbi:MAG: PIN domain-containing protein [Solirubrobacterales bacterium]